MYMVHTNEDIANFRYSLSSTNVLSANKYFNFIKPCIQSLLIYTHIMNRIQRKYDCNL